MAAPQKLFAIADYVVFGMTVLVSVAIGIYFAISGRRKTTTLNYFHGDRKLHYLTVALSLVVTFQSSIMMLGFPAEVYLFGFMICLFNIGQCAAIFVSTRIIVPLIYPLKITSVYEYLNLRYKSNSVRLLSVAIGILSQSIYMGVVLFGPAIALQSVTRFPAWASVLCIALASMVYTSIGGILAVVWTDVLQCVIIVVGIIAIIVKGTIDAGGIQNVIEQNWDSQRLDLFNFDPDPTVRHTFWTIMIGSFIGSFSLTLSQSTIQRFNSTPSITDAKKVLFIAGPVFILLQFMSMSVGLVCFAYYTLQGCDPISSRQIGNPNQIVPFMIVDIFHQYAGLSGLFISALFSASLSTMSSLLAGLSAITVEDLIKPYVNVSDRRLTQLAKISVLAYGGVGILVAWLISQMEGSLTQILFSIMGAATGPAVGIFFLSMFQSKATSKGVIIGGLAGLAISFWICIGATLTPAPPLPLPLPPTSGCVKATNGARNIIPEMENSTSLPLNLVTLPITSTQSPTSVSLTGINFTTPDSILPRNTKQKSTKGRGFSVVYTLSYALYSTIGTITTIIFGFFASLLTFNKKFDNVDPQLLSSLTKQMCCCCCFIRLTRKCCSHEPAPSSDVMKEESHGLTSLDKDV